MGSMLFSTIGMFTSKGVMALALAVCVILTVVSTKAAKKESAAQKKRYEERRKRLLKYSGSRKEKDQLETLYRAGILTREEYEEQKAKSRRTVR